MCGGILTKVGANMDDVQGMQLALKQAKLAALKDEVPVGAIIVCGDQIMARAYNHKELHHLATSHAEILAIQKASRKIGDWRLNECTMYVTLEPCSMCAGALIQARLGRVVFGAYDPKGGAIESTLKLYQTKGFNHYPTVTAGVLKDECAAVLKQYFQHKRTV